MLKIPRAASQVAIRRAYRRLAAEYHPDRNGDPDAEELFKEINEAYHVLSDINLRQQYDTLNLVKDSSTETRRAAGKAPPLKIERGADLQVSITINLFEVAHGAVLEINYQRKTTCLRCGGFGRISAHDGACAGCNGAGRRSQERKLEVNVPPGIEDGTKIKIADQGDDGTLGGPTGDLFVLTKVAEHPLLKRHGQQLNCQVPISVATAALGGHVEMPTPDGVIMVSIPAGAQSGQVLRLRHKGLPKLNERSRGDLLVTLEVMVPIKLNREMREAFKRLEELGDSLHHPALQEYVKQLEECKK